MLDMQTKVNAFGEPTAFIPTDHDAAEFNSMASEMKNLITNFNGTPVALVDYATENQQQLTQAVFAGGNYVVPVASNTYNEAVFTHVLNGGAELPPLAQMKNCMVTWMATTKNTSNGAYTIDWNGEVSLLLHADDLLNPRPEEIRPFSLIQMYCVDFGGGAFLWKIRSVIDSFQGGYLHNRSGNSGVCGLDDSINDSHQSKIGFQIGSLAMMTHTKSGYFKSFELLFNAYNKASNSILEYSVIDSNLMSCSYTVDSSVQKAGFQVPESGFNPSNFVWQWAWGITKYGDISIGLPYNDQYNDEFWHYIWMPNNWVQACQKIGATSAMTFIGRNCYPKGDGISLEIWNNYPDVSYDAWLMKDGNWEKYSGVAPSSIGALPIDLDIGATFQHSVKNSKLCTSYNTPVALGGVYSDTDEFLDFNDKIVQHKIGENTALVTGYDNLTYTSLQSGYKTRIQDGVYDSREIPDSTKDNGGCILFMNGYIISVNGTGLLNQTGVYTKKWDAVSGTINSVADAIYFPKFGAVSPDEKYAYMISSNEAAGQSKVLYSSYTGTYWTVTSSAAMDTKSIRSLMFTDDGAVLALGFSGTNVYVYRNPPTYAKNSWDERIIFDAQITPNAQTYNVPVEDAFGTVYVAVNGILSDNLAKLYISTSPNSSFLLKSYIYPVIDGGEIGRQDVSAIYLDRNEGTNGVLYVAVSNILSTVIRKSTDLGFNWTTAATLNGQVRKIIKTPDEYYYLLVTAPVNDNTILRTKDMINFDTVITYSGVSWELAYSPIDRGIYYHIYHTGGYYLGNISSEVHNRTNSAESPTGIELRDGGFEIRTALPDEAEPINFSLPLLSGDSNNIGILQNVNAPISSKVSKRGSFFREVNDNNRLYLHDINGEISRVGYHPYQPISIQTIGEMDHTFASLPSAPYYHRVTVPKGLIRFSKMSVPVATCDAGSSIQFGVYMSSGNMLGSNTVTIANAINGLESIEVSLTSQISNREYIEHNSDGTLWLAIVKISGNVAVPGRIDANLNIGIARVGAIGDLPSIIPAGSTTANRFCVKLF